MQQAPPKRSWLRRRSVIPDGPIIQVVQAAKSFGKDKAVVHDLNFEVAAGQIFCLLGPSGSGKSTIMRMLTGLYKPSEGHVRVFGQEPHTFKKRWRERMGYMPQQFVLFPELTTWGNINFVASVYGMSWFNRRPKIQRALEFVDLWDSRDKLASQLSGGMQRRLELAATLINNPDLIFVDEPTAGIDPILRAKFWEHFRKLRDENRTIFVTTQYVTEADYCDMVAIINQGRVLAIGQPEQIRRTAFGGEIINVKLEIVTTNAIERIRRVDGVKHVQLLNNKELKLTVDDAGETLAKLIKTLQEGDINIETVEPYRPDFEEVFMRLMEQDTQEETTERNLDRLPTRKAPKLDMDTNAYLSSLSRLVQMERPNPAEPNPDPTVLPTDPSEPEPNTEPNPDPTVVIMPTEPDSRLKVQG